MKLQEVKVIYFESTLKKAIGDRVYYGKGDFYINLL